MPSRSSSPSPGPPSPSVRAQRERALRAVGRHQWIREHDTPRVTILVGPPAQGRALWDDWLALSGRTPSAASIAEQPPGATTAWLERAARQVVALATTSPREPVALAVEPGLLQAWFGRRTDRLGALINEGIVPLPVLPSKSTPRARRTAAHPGGARPAGRKARSSAEERLFAELEKTPSTAGRFELNGLLSVDFGNCAAEVDILSRQDEIAIELDGYHHFQDEIAYRRDRRKDLLLQAHGYVVLRFLSSDIQKDAGPAVRSVIELLGQRRRLQRRRA